MTFLRHALVAAALFVAAVPAGAQDPAPAIRLGDRVVPVRYELRLALDPDANGFDGSVDIQVRVAQPTKRVWINATAIDFVDARAVPSAGAEQPAAVVPGNEDFVGLEFAPPLPAGEATLHLEYKARYSTDEVAGLFRQKEAGDWYVLTQMEPLYARRAFPCFDEPRFRARWRITLTVPEGQRAFSNMPVESERQVAPGRVETTFRETPPIASYLVAIAVGPWDVLDGGVAGRNATPLRYIAPRGRAADASYAASVTPAIVERLESYFGEPYPFAKLDSIVIPNSGYFFGAMENVGLITYDQALLLAAPGEVTARFEQSYVAVAAHEISHQWFGNLVTPAWWDDIWLNESFATWLGDRITAELKPEWRWNFRRIDRRQWAIDSDRLASARRVREPIGERSDVKSAFDNISYAKGASLLAMFEEWLGPDAFREGVRRYMARHAWGTATADDFFAALAAEHDAILPSFRGFVDRVGVPELAVGLDCTGPVPRLVLAQSRFAPKGSTIDPRQRWIFPACFQFGDASRGKAQCTLVREALSSLPLDAESCPSWVVANRAGIGYFLPALSGELYASLPRAAAVLGPLDWVSLLADTQALARAGALAEPTALGLAALTARMDDARVVQDSVAIAEGVPRAATRGADAARYAKWVRAHFAARARALGWRPATTDDADTRRLRRSIVPFVADRGADSVLARSARERAMRWPADAEAVPPETREELLRTAARTATREAPALYEHLYAEAGRIRDARARRHALSALGAFRDPRLAAQSRQLLLAGPYEPRDALLILAAQLDDDALRTDALVWLDRNYEALLARGARDNADALPRWADGACSPAERERFVAVFAERMRTVDGGPRSYAKALERIDLCIAYREAQAGPLSAWLAAGAPSQTASRGNGKMR